MIENIIAYQQNYLEILKEFKKNKNEYDDYLLLLDKIELLLKRNKKTITNFLELNNNNFFYYGGSTYFDSKSNEINPIIFSGKSIIIADPIIKLSFFLKSTEVFNFKRIKHIIDISINTVLDSEHNLLSGKLIYINPNDFIYSIKSSIYETARELTIQYINYNLDTAYSNVDQFVADNDTLSFEELEIKMPKLSKILITVDSTPDMTLQRKINQNYIDCGIDQERFKDISSIEQVIICFIGLFGQALELKSISTILNCPLYITRANVILYLNCINCIDDNDKKRLIISNILFALYQLLKEKKTEDIKCEGKYEIIIDSIHQAYDSIEDYISKIREMNII